MPLFQAIVLAVVQGLTEFLPVSSTAHLVIIPRLFHWSDPGLGFDIALHLGTLIAVVAYFLPTWISLLTRSFSADCSDHRQAKSRTLLTYIFVATIPAAVAGFVFRHAAETSLRNVVLIGSLMVVVGLYMWLAELKNQNAKAINAMKISDAVSVGIAQAFAIIPGVSRSGSTIGAGLFRGLDRDSATRFSFLLSTPIIAGATLLEGSHLLRTGIPGSMRTPFAVGITVSAVSGYIAIWGLVRYLRTRSLMLFVVYRLLLGSALIVAAVTVTI